MMLNNEFSGLVSCHLAVILDTNQHDMYIVRCQQGLCLVRHEQLEKNKKKKKTQLSQQQKVFRFEWQLP